jgi:hypothetical protein
MKAIKLPIALAALVVAGLSTANAIPQLKLISGSVTKTITDGGPGDTTPAGDGVINWSGSVDKWSVNFTSAQTKPSQGDSLIPTLILQDQSTSLVGAKPLTILFSETGFAAQPVDINTSINGTVLDKNPLTGKAVAGGSIKFDTYAGTGLFDLATHITGQGPYTAGMGAPSPGFASGIANVSIDLGAVYSLTSVIVLQHNNAQKGQTQFNAELDGFPVTVPEGGSTLILLGSILSGMGMMARARRVEA